MNTSTQSFAPILLFVYNRYAHTAKTLASLQANPEAINSDLFVYADGAKSAEHTVSVEKVRSLFQDLTGFRSVTLIAREKNFGLAQNIIAGVTDVCNQYGRVIVIEDDLALSPFFLQFMNENLQRYENVQAVGSIHGYVIPTTHVLPKAFFLRGADCWGWATWQRSWAFFEKDGTKLLKSLTQSGLAQSFDMDGLAGNLGMLQDQIAGKNNSWAIRWHASLYLANKLTLYPGTSLVNNIGTDNSGEHCVTTDVYSTAVSQQPIIFDPSMPLIESAQGLAAYRDFFKQLKPSLIKRVIRKVKRIVAPAV